MRAAQITEYGGADVLAYTDSAEQPITKAKQVLVEVYAAGVNPFDWKVREGLMRSMAEPALPATLGGDCAGIVAAVGEEVTDFEIGQAVFGQAGALSGKGSYAEYTCVKANALALKPESVDFAAAAALPLASVSAYQALVDHIQLQAGQRILIHGGAGGIGTLAIQLAKQYGAYVITTATGSDREFVAGLGADEVIDYRTQDFADVVSDLDAVYDTIGGETNKKSYGILKPGGVLVSMVEPADEAIASEHQITYTFQFTGVTTERLSEIAALVDAGKLRTNIDKVFPLEAAAEALEYVKTAHPRGKVVIQVK